MATNKWLNIIVDGNSAMAPHWPNIFSHCLEKIIRTFFEDSINEGANAQLGLVMYNANSNPGLEFVQYIYWTREIDCFLAVLSSLLFNGNNENQHTMVQGLAEALVMFPRPSNVMTTEEYYYGTRHCIVIAARDPIPRKMPVSVPEIIPGRTIGTQLCTINADFYDVAELFRPLALSLSIISPVQHPCFGVIFNLANNGSPLETTPISNTRIGQFNVMLSRNFREAYAALRGKRIMHPYTDDIGVPVNYANDDQEDLFSIANMMTNRGIRINEAARDIPQTLDQQTINPVSLVVPNVSTTAVGIPTPPMVIPNAATSTTREWSSQGLGQEERGIGMADPRGFPPAHNSTPFLSSENSFNIEPYLSTLMLPHMTLSSSSDSYPNLPYLAAGFDPYGRPIYEPNGVPLPPMIPQFNPSDFWPPQSFTSCALDLVVAWQGNLVARTHKNRRNIQRGRALRRATSPSTLTIEWWSRLETASYIPQRALDYTITIFRGPVDYVFFYMVHFNNLDLHEHMTKSNLCAKVTLTSQILIISPTENKHYYIGTVFPEDVTFVEMN